MTNTKSINMKQVEGVSRTDMFKIDPRVITVTEGWNPRETFDAEKLEELKESIIENGVLVPIRVKLSADNKIVLIDGERRLRATLMAIEEGADIRTIPAINERKTMKPVDMLLLALTTNTGERLTVMEEAKAIKKLYNWGLDQKEIAKKLGKSVGTINGRLQMLDADESILEELDKGEITINDVKNIVKNSDGTKEVQEEKLKEVKKKKVIDKIQKKTSKKECVELLEESLEWLIELSKDQEEYPQLQDLIKRINEVADE